MKTTQILGLFLLTSIGLLCACQKDEFENDPALGAQSAEIKSTVPLPTSLASVSWQEDFSTASSLASSWKLYGSRQPQWVYSACNRKGLFDNNGSLPNGSFAVSKSKIGDGNGYTIESDVCINITNTEGTSICPGIGVTADYNPAAEYTTINEGISLHMIYIGNGVTEVDPQYRNHTYVVATAMLYDGRLAASGDFALQTDFAGNGWHKLKIVVTAAKKVSFYLDNQLMYSPKEPIHASLVKGKNVVLGFSSPGSAGKAYHDFVKVTYPVIPDQLSAPRPEMDR